MKAFVSQVQYSNGLAALRALFTLANGTTYSAVAVDLDVSGSAIVDMAELKSRSVAAILAYSATNSLGLSASDIMFDDWVQGMANAPQAAIADVTGDLPTNLNTVTTLLGVLTAQMNETNAKVNALRACLNAVLAKDRTLGLISS